MQLNKPASLSLAELRDGLRARIGKQDSTDGLDLREVLRFYGTLPASSHTLDAADGLIQLASSFSFAAQPGGSEIRPAPCGSIRGSDTERVLEPSEMDTFLAEGAEALEYVPARGRMEALIGAHHEL